MAGKRSATSDLNADNWNQEEEPEEAGTFQKASDEILTRRVVRTAKRRLGAGGDDAVKSAFGTFTGFKSTPAATNTSAPFSFLSKASSDSGIATSSSSSFIPNKTPTTNGSTKISENGIGMSLASTASSPLLSKDTKSGSSDSSSPKRPPEYYAKLKGLNQSVAKWIKTHVDANAVCILTPIFRDYEKYLKEIEEKHGKELDSTKLVDKSEGKIEFKPTGKSQLAQTTGQAEKKPESFMFGSSNKTPASEAGIAGWKPEKSIFGSSSMSGKSMFASGDNKSSFSATSTVISDKSPFFMKSPSAAGIKQNETKSDEKPTTSPSFPQVTQSSSTFSFGQASANSVSAGFSFGGGKPFTFGGGAAVKPAEEKPAENEDKEDEDDEPPKPDFKPVTEEGSIYEQKCKVFVKKDNNYSDRGVGTLFLKPTSNDKMQLIVRAINSLGNLLMNILLSESIPVKRLNKTNIMLVCVPLSNTDTQPVATLLRVKTSEEADALFEALEKHKK